MFGKLLNRFFGRRDRARPVSPAPPPIPPRPEGVSAAPPPPPPPPVASPTPIPRQDPVAAQISEAPVRVVSETEDAAAGSRVRFVLEDGTMASPALEPDLEERLKYIVDNIVPPSEPDST